MPNRRCRRYRWKQTDGAAKPIVTEEAVYVVPVDERRHRSEVVAPVFFALTDAFDLVAATFDDEARSRR